VLTVVRELFRFLSRRFGVVLSGGVLAWLSVCSELLQLAADLHMAQLMPLPSTVSCFTTIQIAFTFVVPAHLGTPGQRAVKRTLLLLLFGVVSRGPTTIGGFPPTPPPRVYYQR